MADSMLKLSVSPKSAATEEDTSPQLLQPNKGPAELVEGSVCTSAAAFQRPQHCSEQTGLQTAAVEAQSSFPF